MCEGLRAFVSSAPNCLLMADVWKEINLSEHY